jgi:hypothetical protein
MREGSTEYAIFVCFKSGVLAHNPLEHITRLGNPNLPFPISFIYGEVDWMDNQGAERAITVNRSFGKLCRIYYVAGSDHNMYIDNPKGTIKVILKDVKLMNMRKYKDEMLYY